MALRLFYLSLLLHFTFFVSRFHGSEWLPGQRRSHQLSDRPCESVPHFCRCCDQALETTGRRETAATCGCSYAEECFEEAAESIEKESSCTGVIVIRCFFQVNLNFSINHILFIACSTIGNSGSSFVLVDCSSSRLQHSVTIELIWNKDKEVAQDIITKFKEESGEIKKKIHYAAFVDFAASVGWYQGFAKRYGLKSGKLSGESASAPVEIAEEGQMDLKKILEEYDPGKSMQSLNRFYSSVEYAEFTAFPFFVLCKRISGTWMDQRYSGKCFLIELSWFPTMCVTRALISSCHVPPICLSF